MILRKCTLTGRARGIGSGVAAGASVRVGVVAKELITQ